MDTDTTITVDVDVDVQNIEQQLRDIGDAFHEAADTLRESDSRSSPAVQDCEAADSLAETDEGTDWNVPNEYESLVEWVKSESGLITNDYNTYGCIGNSVSVTSDCELSEGYFTREEERNLRNSPFEVVDGDIDVDETIVVAPEDDTSMPDGVEEAVEGFRGDER